MNPLYSHQSIVRRFQLGIGLAAWLILGLTVWSNYRTAPTELQEQSDARATLEIRAAARRLEDFVGRVGMVPLMAQQFAHMQWVDRKSWQTSGVFLTRLSPAQILRT